MSERNRAFLTFRRPEVVDPSPGVLTEQERAHIEERIGAGVSPRFPVIRKVVRLADERRRDLEAERALLNRVRRVVEQARQMPHRYPGTTAVDFIHNILIGDDDLG